MVKKVLGAGQLASIRLGGFMTLQETAISMPDSIGQEVIITERGKPIGRIIPFSPKKLSLEDRIRILEEQGLTDPLSNNSVRRLPPPLPAPEGLAQKYLQEGRNR